MSAVSFTESRGKIDKVETHSGQKTKEIKLTDLHEAFKNNSKDKNLKKQIELFEKVNTAWSKRQKLSEPPKREKHMTDKFKKKEVNLKDIEESEEVPETKEEKHDIDLPQ